ncbi:MAG: diacylglycerol kinase family lipid kinase [Ktedonobacteraceae bacterium]
MTQQHTTQSTSLPIPADISKSACFAIIIANPTSGSYIQHQAQMEENMAFLRKAGWRVDLRLTEQAGDAQRLARVAVEEKAQVVIAAGGDGTINEVIQELVGSETALGVLPIGTVNVWAREMDIPLDDAGAREVLVHGRTRVIDVGKVNERYFLLMVGIGFDGEVTHTVEKKSLKRLGVVGYLLASFWMGLGYESFPVTLKFADREVKTRALQIVIGNTQLYGGAVKFTWQAKCDDGLLDICIVRKRSRLRRILVLLDFLLHREQRRQWVSYETCDSIELVTQKPVAMQVDGDAVGHTPATFTAMPGALKVIVPQKTPEGLFSHE